MTEMRTLREATFKHMTAELDAFRVARDEALATIAAHVEKQVCIAIDAGARGSVSERPQTTTTAALPVVPSSLKRKRQDEEDDADGADAECEGRQDQASLVGGGLPPTGNASNPAMMLNNPAAYMSAAQQQRYQALQRQQQLADAAAQTSATSLPPPSTSAVSALADHSLFHSCGAMAESSRSPPLRKGNKHKRARRFAAVAVQTATAATVGAIATWSALAFS